MGFTADSVDLEQLRHQFAPPFDRAAQVVQRAGYEQDDAVIDRYLVCLFGSAGPHLIPAESLADRDRFVNHLMDAARLIAKARLAAADIRVVGLRVKAVLEQWE